MQMVGVRKLFFPGAGGALGGGSFSRLAGCPYAEIGPVAYVAPFPRIDFDLAEALRLAK